LEERFNVKTLSSSPPLSDWYQLLEGGGVEEGGSMADFILIYILFRIYFFGIELNGIEANGY
jgi:hypothetical protein